VFAIAEMCAHSFNLREADVRWIKNLTGSVSTVALVEVQIELEVLPDPVLVNPFLFVWKESYSCANRTV
jgi:hypothetical protein